VLFASVVVSYAKPDAIEDVPDGGCDGARVCGVTGATAVE
jgi:hypothetical protein